MLYIIYNIYIYNIFNIYIYIYIYIYVCVCEYTYVQMFACVANLFLGLRSASMLSPPKRENTDLEQKRMKKFA